MRINFNGEVFQSKDFQLPFSQISQFFNSAVREDILVNDQTILFREEIYFSLMAQMRIMRLNIPIAFTEEFFEQEILKCLSNKPINENLSFYVFEGDENQINYLITENHFKLNFKDETSFVIDVYKDYQVDSQLFGRINFPNAYQKIATQYCLENNLDDLVLLNREKKVARTLKGNIFLIKNDEIIVPKVENGVLMSGFYKGFKEKLKEYSDNKMVEKDIFAFELTQCDEIFILINGVGIQSVNSLRKNSYVSNRTSGLKEKILF